MTDGDSERIAALEVEVRYLAEKIDGANTRLDAMCKAVTQLRDVFMQAKGARWALVAVFSIMSFAGGLAANLIVFAR